MDEEILRTGTICAKPASWRRPVLVIIVVAALGVLAAWPVSRFFHSKLVVRACFQDAAGLQVGAGVRIAGVDVGRVRIVRAQPENHFCPARVEMLLSTPDELKIPRDSIASAQTAGILGATYVEIDSSAASGPPLDSGGELKTRSTERLTPQQWLDLIERLTRKDPCGAKNEGKGVQSVKP